MIKNFNEYTNESHDNVDFNYDELCVLLSDLTEYPEYVQEEKIKELGKLSTKLGLFSRELLNGNISLYDFNVNDLSDLEDNLDIKDAKLAIKHLQNIKFEKVQESVIKHENSFEIKSDKGESLFVYENENAFILSDKIGILGKKITVEKSMIKDFIAILEGDKKYKLDHPKHSVSNKISQDLSDILNASVDGTSYDDFVKMIKDFQRNYDLLLTIPSKKNMEKFSDIFDWEDEKDFKDTILDKNDILNRWPNLS